MNTDQWLIVGALLCNLVALAVILRAKKVTR